MKRTYQPNNRKKSKKLGFFARKKTNILNRRRRKVVKVFVNNLPLPKTVVFYLWKGDYMKKMYIVKHQYDFDRIIKTGYRNKNDIFIVYSMQNNLNYARYGISVGKKLGNAVYRNRKKRQIRSIIDNFEKDYVNNKDYIIILREKGKNLDYQTLNQKLKSLIMKERTKNEKAK